MTIWSLHVDESGDFSDGATGPIWVAGVLSRHENTPRLERTLRRRLRAAAPHAPWPLHSWLLLRPVCHALWWRVAGSPGASEPAGAADAIAHAHAHAPGALDACLGAMRQGHEPTRKHLRVLERALRGTPANDRLRAYTHDVVAATARALADGSRLEGTPALFAASCGEGEPGAVSRTPGAPAPGGLDRYLQCLGGLLERVRDAVGACAPGQPQRVDVTLATRDVHDPILGERAPLSRASFARVVDALADHDDARVTFTCAGLRRYDADASALLVAADLVANRAYRAARHETSLRELAALSRSTTGLTPCTHARPDLPLVAAMGATRAALLSHAPAAPPLSHDDLPGSARWARDQAVAWTTRPLHPKDPT